MKRIKDRKFSNTKNFIVSSDNISLDVGLDLIELGKGEFVKKDIDGVKVLVSLDHLQVFKKKGHKCVSCHTKGSFFKVEKAPGDGNRLYNKWHLNLYGFDYLGREVLMTKDHIVARANDGKDAMSNYQPMCYRCNNQKGTRSMQQWISVSGNSYVFDNKNFERHLIEVSKEFYDIDLSVGDYVNCLYQIIMGDSLLIKKLSKTIQYHIVYIGKDHRELPLVYNSKSKKIVSLLDQRAFESIDLSVPHWARGHEKSLDDKVGEIFETGRAEYIELGDMMEMINYFKSCTYPGVMFGIWKKDPLINEKVQLIAKRELGL